MTEALFIPYALEKGQNHPIEDFEKLCSPLKENCLEESYGAHDRYDQDMDIPDTLDEKDMGFHDRDYTEYTFAEGSLTECYVTLDRMGRIFIGDIQIFSDLEIQGMNPQVFHYTEEEVVETGFQDLMDEF